MRGQLFESQAFPAALGGGGRIRGDIAGAAVQQTVIGPGSAGVDVPLFHDHALNTPQGQIAGQAGAGNTAADDENRCLQGSIPGRFPLLDKAKWRGHYTW